MKIGIVYFLQKTFLCHTNQNLHVQSPFCIKRLHQSQPRINSYKLMRPKVAKRAIKQVYLISVTSPNLSNITLFARLSIGLVSISCNSMWQVLQTPYVKTSASMSRTSRVWFKTLHMHISDQKKTQKYTKKEKFLNFGGQTQTLRKHGFSQFSLNIDQTLDLHH